MAAHPPPFSVHHCFRHPTPPLLMSPSLQPRLQQRFPSTGGLPTQAALPPLPETGGADPPPTAAPKCTVALLVRHLPEAMPPEVIARLFSHYGASSVLPCAGGRLRFLGKVLSVERASKAMFGDSPQENEKQPAKELSRQLVPSLNDHSVVEKLSKAATVNSAPSGEPIASRLGVDYPFPPYLDSQPKAY